MATYAIGDIHGCYDQLQRLLQKIKFDPNSDTLWFTGDLVNGGPQPAEAIRFIRSLGNKHICVLGNHDLTLLGIAAGKIMPRNDRVIGFEPILQAPDCAELTDWLRTLPLAHYDSNFNALIFHAGIPPQWDLKTTLELANEVESMLCGPRANELFSEMYGNLPDVWDENLFGWDRLRFVINCFTRMRFCDAHGRLEFNSKGPASTAPRDLFPWFTAPDRKTESINIIFGHWASLEGKTGIANVYAIDTGCVWGQSLTAICLDNWQRYSVPAQL